MHPLPTVELGNGRLDLVCGKCTRTAAFLGATKDDAIDAAAAAGWTEHRGKIVCPKCPAPRARAFRNAGAGI